MKAAIFEDFGKPLDVCEVDDPEPASGSVILRVEACGICRSDWHGWMGHDPDVSVPHVPGHELAGTVAAVGGGISRWKVGDRVTVPFACGCGNCRYCRAGQLNICDAYFQPGFTHWGAFAELVEIRYADTNLVRIPDAMDFVTAASLGCRFSTAYRAVVHQARPNPGDWIAVHGCGGLGLSAVMIAQATGARVVAIDVQPPKLDLAKAFGAVAVINARETKDVAGAVREITGGGADASLDTLGSRTTCCNSVLCLRKQGRHVQVGLLVGEEADPPLPMSAVIGRELEILGSHGLSALDYPALLKMVESGALRPKRLVRKRISLEQAGSELEAMGSYDTQGVTVIDRFSGHHSMDRLG